MENDPNEEWEFCFKVNDKRYEATKDNTYIILHELPEDSKFDFIASMYEDESGDNCIHVQWRGEDDDPEDKDSDFNNLVEDMYHAGFDMTTAPRVTDSIRELYYKAFPAPEPKRHILTKRQERFLQYFNYLLTLEYLEAEDFLTPGELFI